MPLRHNNLPGRHFSRGGLVRHRLRHVGDPHCLQAHRNRGPGSRRGNVDCDFVVPTPAFQSLH